MIFHNTKLINLGETEVSLFLFVLLVVSFSSPRDADNLSLRFENVCISRRGLLFYCTSFWNLHMTFFGLGLALFATPITDVALSDLYNSDAGVGSGIFKMASSLGAAIGVAISTGLFMGISMSSNKIRRIAHFAG